MLDAAAEKGAQAALQAVGVPAASAAVSNTNLDSRIEQHKGQQGMPFSEGDTEMARHRHRVRISYNDDGTPVYKEVQAQTLDELHDRIVQVYIDSGRIREFLSIPTEPYTEAQTAASDKPEEKITLMAYVENWLAVYKQSKLKPTTLKGYRSMLRAHIYPAFGDRCIAEITTGDIQNFLNDRQNLAEKTLNTMLVFLREIFSDAKEDGAITVNPTNSRRITIPSQKKHVREALELWQIKNIIQSISCLQDDDRRFMSLLLFTGMRRGEVLGLRWEDIDIENGLIHVGRNVTFTNNQPHIGTPKTKKGTRDIPIDAQLINALAPFQDDGYIIGGEKPITLTQYRNLWARIEKKIDLYGATAHVFRHSYLTLAAGTGLDIKTLQTIAGHADIQTTMNRYVHSQPDKILEAGKKIEALLAV